MNEWLSQNAGTVITVGGSVVVAVIGGAFMVWAKNHTPASPTPIQDVWSENRTLRTEVRDLENAFDVGFRWIEQAVRDWNTGKPLPQFSDEDRAIIGKIRRAPDTNHN